MPTRTAPSPRAKLSRPEAPAAALQRPALRARLAAAAGRRLWSVVADAGFGKSTLLAAWCEDRPHAWYSAGPEDASLPVLAAGILDALAAPLGDPPRPLRGAIATPAGPAAQEREPDRARVAAASICEWLDGALDADLTLVIDDLHEAAGALEPVAFLDALVRYAPPKLHVGCSSRTDLPFPIDRLRGRGEVLELTGADLRFGPDEVRAFVAPALGGGDPSLADAIAEATGGWPAAIRLAIEALRHVDDAERVGVLERLRSGGGPIDSYLSAEVFRQERREVSDLVRDAARLHRFDADVLEALGHAGARRILDELSRRGLFVEPERGGQAWFTLSPLVRRYALESMPVPDAAALLLRAAGAFAGRGLLDEALRATVESGNAAAVGRFLAEHGPAVLAGGAVELVVEAAGLLDPDRRDEATWRLEGEARQVRGDWDGALACFERAGAGRDELHAGLAWRLGLIHYLRGDLDEALRAYRRGRVDGTSPRDEALLLAWRATVHIIRGQADACASHAAQALRLARAAGDAQALAAAHTVLAMHARFSGERTAMEEHDARALEEALRAQDTLQLVRIRTNRGGHLVDGGRFAEALAELDGALALADLAGFANFRALALSNRGEAKARLGRLDEAITDLEGARAQWERLGSGAVCYALAHLGSVYGARGDVELSRGAYEQAIALAEKSGDMQGLLPAVSGLARLVASEDPDHAAGLAARAVEQSSDATPVAVLLAQAHVALERNDRDAASAAAAAAVVEARRRSELAWLAEALILRARCASEPAAAVAGLEEALAIARRLEARILEAEPQIALASLRPADEARTLAEQAMGSLRACGARARAAAAEDLMARLDRRAPPPLRIEVLGGFRVVRDGEAVPASTWRSKKARDLVKLLVARRGRPATRESLMEALWPEEDPSPLANRLSVALATARSVLDPDRTDRFIAADRSTVALNLEAVEVDIERFLAEARAALDTSGPERTKRLAVAEGLYAGDFLEGDVYEDWAVSLRQEARVVYLTVAHALGVEAGSAGDHDTAARCYLRVLERDPYDETAHLGLVSALEHAGRHGEARRSYRAYCGRMDELSVEAAPFPAA